MEVCNCGSTQFRVPGKVQVDGKWTSWKERQMDELVPDQEQQDLFKFDWEAMQCVKCEEIFGIED